MRLSEFLKLILRYRGKAWIFVDAEGISIISGGINASLEAILKEWERIIEVCPEAPYMVLMRGYDGRSDINYLIMWRKFWDEFVISCVKKFNIDPNISGLQERVEAWLSDALIDVTERHDLRCDVKSQVIVPETRPHELNVGFLVSGNDFLEVANAVKIMLREIPLDRVCKA